MTGSKYAKAISIKIDGAGVVKATEEGAVVDILLDAATAPDAVVSVTFGTENKMGTNYSVSGTMKNVKLEDGVAQLSMKLETKIRTITLGSVTYTLNFLADKVPTTVPTRIVEFDSKFTYSGVVVI